MDACNARCKAILKERYEKRPLPAIWNSLTHLEQVEWSRHEHISAAAGFIESKRGSWGRRLLHTFKFLFTKKQFERWLAAAPPCCPTCGKEQD